MFGMVPGFPNRCQLHNDLHLVSSVICQGHHSTQECTNFCLGSSGHSTLKLSQGHGVSGQAEEVIGGGSGIQSEGPAAVLLEWDDLQSSPASMPFQDLIAGINVALGMDVIGHIQ